jgi:hypothetical protein
MRAPEYHLLSRIEIELPRRNPDADVVGLSKNFSHQLVPAVRNEFAEPESKLLIVEEQDDLLLVRERA